MNTVNSPTGIFRDKGAIKTFQSMTFPKETGHVNSAFQEDGSDSEDDEDGDDENEGDEESRSSYGSRLRDVEMDVMVNEAAEETNLKTAFPSVPYRKM